jgi:hypothetical protein
MATSVRTRVGVSILVFAVVAIVAFAQSGFETAEFQARWKAALEKVPDGIVLLRSSWGLKHWDESGFHQGPSFYYFSGLANAHGAILALDGTKKESWLFVSPKIPLGGDLHGFDSVFLDPGPQTERDLGIDHVVAWDQFVAFIDSRRKDSPKLIVYTDQGGQTGFMSGDSNLGTPPGLGPLQNPNLTWVNMLHQHWSDLEMKEAFEILDEVRSVKSPRGTCPDAQGSGHNRGRVLGRCTRDRSGKNAAAGGRRGAGCLFPSRLGRPVDMAMGAFGSLCHGEYVV